MLYGSKKIFNKISDLLLNSLAFICSPDKGLRKKENCMNGFKEVMETLQEQNIEVQLVEHEAVITMEDADRVIEGIPGVRTKTLFLMNKKKTKFYLLIMDEDKRLDMAAFKELVDDRQLKMASEEMLYEKLGLQPGGVSPFGLLNDKDGDVEVYIDKDIADEERMSFHPNTNEKTVFIKTVDLYPFLEHIGHPAKTVLL